MPSLKQKKSQPVEKTPLAEEDEDSPFAEQLKEFFAELNVSKEQIISAVVGLVILTILGVGGYFGYRWYTNRPSSAPPSPATSAPPSATPEKGKSAVDATTTIGKEPHESLRFLGTTGLGSSAAVGSPAAASRPLAYYINAFKRFQNAYGTDVMALMNASKDRRARLKSHILLMRSLHQEGIRIVDEINLRLIDLQRQYEAQSLRQRTADTNFFEQFTALNGQTAQDNLEIFTDASEKVATLRAQFKALERARLLFDSGLPRLAARVQDLELNEDALVNGIKVYDVAGSDLNLIVQPRTQPVVPRDQSLGGTVNGFPLIPVHPADVSTGEDYITKPGGGF